MSYDFCVTQPGYLPEHEKYAVAPTAVPTIEAARAAARDFCDDRYAYYGRYHADANALPESGGVVGPLPDGCVIIVQVTAS